MGVKIYKKELAAIGGSAKAEEWGALLDCDGQPGDGVVNVRPAAKDISGGLSEAVMQLEALSFARNATRTPFFVHLSPLAKAERDAIDLKLQVAERAIARKVSDVARIGQGVPLVDEFVRTELRRPPVSGILGAAPSKRSTPLESPESLLVRNFPHLRQLQDLGWDLPKLLRADYSGSSAMAQLLIYGIKLGKGVHQIGITSRVRDVAAVERALRHAALVGGSAVEVAPEHLALAQRVLAGTGMEVSAVSFGPGR